MLERVDRVQLAVRERAAAEETFRDLLGAEKVREESVELLAARRSVMQAGISQFELLEPTDEGPVQAYLERWGEGIFSAGFSVGDLPSLARRLSDRGIRWREEGGQVYIDSDQTPGLRMVLTAAYPQKREAPVGAIKWLYEATNIVDSHVEASRFYAQTFGLDSAKFHPIKSDQYGYVGSLLLFDPPHRLDRIELAEITDPSLAMGRFAAKRGQSIYMAYVETDDVAEIARRLDRRGARWAGRRNDPNLEGLFIHPTALHGMLLGVSRTNLAWSWSGRPDLAGR